MLLRGREVVARPAVKLRFLQEDPGAAVVATDVGGLDEFCGESALLRVLSGTALVSQRVSGLLEEMGRLGKGSDRVRPDVLPAEDFRLLELAPRMVVGRQPNPTSTQLNSN